MQKSSLLRLAVIAAGTAAVLCFGQEPTVEQRRQQIVGEMSKRREKREELRFLTGEIYYPKSADDDGTERQAFDLIEVPAGRVAQILANISGKEVMVSRYIAPRPVSVKGKDLSRMEAVERLTKALRTAGVRVTDLGRSTVALSAADD